MVFFAVINAPVSGETLKTFPESAPFTPFFRYAFLMQSKIELYVSLGNLVIITSFGDNVGHGLVKPATWAAFWLVKQ